MTEELTPAQRAEIDRRVGPLVKACPEKRSVVTALELIIDAGPDTEEYLACALEDLYRLKNWTVRCIQTLEAIALRHGLDASDSSEYVENAIIEGYRPKGRGK